MGFMEKLSNLYFEKHYFAGIYMDCLDSKSICNLIDIEEFHEFEALYERTRNVVHNYGYDIAFTKTHKKIGNNYVMSVVSLYIVIKVNASIKRYDYLKDFQYYFAEKAATDLIWLLTKNENI